jgi:RNA polymerase sigma-70 factor (sigma-E family)
MSTTGNDTASTREDELLAGVYQQVIDAQAAQYATAYDAAAGLAWFTGWLKHHAPAGPEPDADQMVAQLYAEHYRPLVRLAALLVRDTATAEDVVQDAFIAMRGGWQRLGDADRALAYLRQAVVNRSRSVLRHRIVGGGSLQQVPPDPPGAEQGPPGLLDQSAVRAALHNLPDRQREAIMLRYYSGLSEQEIAAAMRISRGAVKSHTARGLAALRAVAEQASSHPARPGDSESESDDPRGSDDDESRHD